MTNQFTPLVQKYATKYGIPFEILCGLIERESGWDQYCIRFEPQFYQEYVIPLMNSKRITNITEAEARAMSWGLMQPLLETAREFGYSGPAAQLCDPETGLDIGCKILANKLKSAQDLESGLLRWNGGSNKQYGAEVIALAAKYKTPTA
jgi:soluble lytic murein transglycosylase-like protein